jgi:hypothetical protein
MGADVAERAGAGAFRIGTPVGLLLAGRLKPFGQPVLRVFRLDVADSPSSPAAIIARACRIIG